MAKSETNIGVIYTGLEMVVQALATNNNNTAVNDVYVKFEIPEGVEFVSAGIIPGSYDEANKVWNIGTLMGNQSVVGDFTFAVTDGCRSSFVFTFIVDSYSGCGDCFSEQVYCVINEGISCCDLVNCDFTKFSIETHDIPCPGVFNVPITEPEDIVEGQVLLEIFQDCQAFWIYNSGWVLQNVPTSPTGLISAVTNTITGNQIAVHDSGASTTPINETITDFTNVITGGNSIGDYVDESGALHNVRETITSITGALGTGQTIGTFEDEAGNSTVIRETITTLDNVQAGKLIGRFTSENGTVSDIDETITTLVDAGSGIYNYTNENGTITAIDTNTIVPPVDFATGSTIAITNETTAETTVVIAATTGTNNASNALVSGLTNTNLGDGDQAILTGSSNTNSGSNSLVAGLSNNNISNHTLMVGSSNISSEFAASCIIGGGLNDVSGSNSLVVGQTNTTTGSGMIVGGVSNNNQGTNNLLVGGSNGGSGGSNVIGGLANVADGGASLIVGSTNNVGASCIYNIVGGINGIINTNGSGNILAGNNNTISSNDCIVTGFQNEIEDTAENSAIIGGNTSKIYTGAHNCLITASEGSEINVPTFRSAIVGSRNCFITGSAVSESEIVIAASNLVTSADSAQCFFAGTESLTISGFNYSTCLGIRDSLGNLAVNGSDNKSKTFVGDLIIRNGDDLTAVPVDSDSSNGYIGQILFDLDYLYVYVNDTQNWKRVALSTF